MGKEVVGLTERGHNVVDGLRLGFRAGGGVRSSWWWLGFRAHGWEAGDREEWVRGRGRSRCRACLGGRPAADGYEDRRRRRN